MISFDQAADQIARLDATDNYHWKTEQAIEELTTCLMRNSTDEAEARRAISSWLSAQRECPTPADLIAALAEVREAAPAAQHSPTCKKCLGTGFQLVHQLATPTVGGATLVQDLGSGNDGWKAADAFRDQWDIEHKAWIANHPKPEKGQYYKPERRQYVAEAARRCDCGAGTKGKR